MCFNSCAVRVLARMRSDEEVSAHESARKAWPEIPVSAMSAPALLSADVRMPRPPTNAPSSAAVQRYTGFASFPSCGSLSVPTATAFDARSRSTRSGAIAPSTRLLVAPVRPVRRGEGLSDSPSGWRCAWADSMAARTHRAVARVSRCGAAADLAAVDRFRSGRSIGATDSVGH